LDTLDVPFADESPPATPAAVSGAEFKSHAPDAGPDIGDATDESLVSGSLDVPPLKSICRPTPNELMRDQHRLCPIPTVTTGAGVHGGGCGPTKRYSVGSGLAVTGYRCSIIVAGPVAIQPLPSFMGGRTPGSIVGSLGGQRRCEPTHFHWTSTGTTLAKTRAANNELVRA
jgi:hypothetical protein